MTPMVEFVIYETVLDIRQRGGRNKSLRIRHKQRRKYLRQVFAPFADQPCEDQRDLAIGYARRLARFSEASSDCDLPSNRVLRTCEDQNLLLQTI